MKNAWHSLTDIAERIEDRISIASTVDVTSLCIFRVISGLFVLAFACKSTVWVATLPSALFLPLPLNVVSLLGGFPSRMALGTLDVASILAAFALTIGLCTRASTIAVAVTVFAASAVSYSFGKITHDVLYPLFFLAMAGADWGRELSVDAWLRSRRDTNDQQHDQSGVPTSTSTDLRLLAFLIAFGFFTAAAPKALVWLDFDTTTSGVLRWVYNAVHVRGDAGLLGGRVAAITAPVLWELADVATVVFELAAMAAVLSFGAWRMWLAAACAFHLMNCLVLSIAFYTNMISYLAFAPWAVLTPALVGRKAPPAAVMIIAAALTLANLRLIGTGPPRGGLAYKLLDQMPRDGAGLLLSCALWLSALAVMTYSAVRAWQNRSD